MPRDIRELTNDPEAYAAELGPFRVEGKAVHAAPRARWVRGWFCTTKATTTVP